MQVRLRVGALAVPLRNRQTRSLLLGFGVSELGDGISAVVVPLAIYDVTSSLSATAAASIGRVVLGSVGALIGGSLADRHDRRRLLLGSYAVRAGVLIALIILLENDHALVTLGVLLGALGAVDNPSAEALLRSRLPDHLQAVASMRAMARSMSSIVGPASGALLLSIGGTRTALAIDLASFVIAWVLVLLSRDVNVGRAAPAADPVDSRSGALAGIRFALREETVTLGLLSSFVGGFVVAVVTLLAIPYLDSLDSAPTGSYGWCLAAYAVGALAGVGAAGLLDWKVGTRRLLISANVVYALFCLLSVAGSAWWLVGVAWFGWGVAYGPEQVVADARIAERTPPTILGRVYGLWVFLTRTAAVLGYLTAGSVRDTSSRGAILVVGVAYLFLAPAALALVPSRDEQMCQRSRANAVS